MLQKTSIFFRKKKVCPKIGKNGAKKSEKIGRNAKIAAKKHCESSTTF